MLTQKYQKQTLTPLQKVASEALSQNEQAYEMVYYEKTPKFTDKIAIYFKWKAINNPDKEYAKRSTFFLDPEQLKRFIQNSIHSYLFFIEKRFSETLPISLAEHRRIILEGFLNSIEREQLKRWKNGNNENANTKTRSN